jgi:protein-S-isoprenylcysteine O-methyltransferase Ste14
VKRTLYLVYGTLSYVVSLGTSSYAIGFVGNVLVPRSVDRGGPLVPVGTALLIDALLLTLFAVQHSGMATGSPAPPSSTSTCCRLPSGTACTTSLERPALTGRSA